MRRYYLFILLALATWLSVTSATQAASYTFTKLDFPGEQATSAHGMNTQGQIVGVYIESPPDLNIQFKTHGFLYDRD